MMDKILGAASLPVRGFLQVYSIIKNFGFFWAVLQHWGELKKMSERLAEIIKRMKIQNDFPTCDESKEMVGMLRFLFEKKILDFPNVDEAVMAQALREIEEKWVCSIEEKQKETLRG